MCTEIDISLVEYMVFIKFSALRSFNETEKNYHNIPRQNIILITGSLKLMEKNQVRQYFSLA